jgi:hypothetical protein
MENTLKLLLINKCNRKGSCIMDLSNLPPFYAAAESRGTWCSHGTQIWEQHGAPLSHTFSLITKARINTTGFNKNVTDTHFTTYSARTPMIICTPLLLKSGAAPFHWWFPGVTEGLRWENYALLITVQKAAPLILISYLIEINIFTLRIIIISTIVGSIGGLNQTSIRKILTSSCLETQNIYTELRNSVKNTSGIKILRH